MANDYWGTPQEFFEKLNEEFEFTLDAAADEFNHKCNNYYTEEINGLIQDWSNERVFINPPYSRGQIKKWLKKAYEETSNKCELVVLLIPSRTGTKYWHDFVMKANEIRFIKGRLRFINPETGKQASGSDFIATCLVIFKKNENDKLSISAMEKVF